METINNQEPQATSQSGTVDYAAALRQYNRYGRGRSMKKFCEDEGYDYWKFCGVDCVCEQDAFHSEQIASSVVHSLKIVAKFLGTLLQLPKNHYL